MYKQIAIVSVLLMTLPSAFAATEVGQETATFKNADFGDAACGMGAATCFDVPPGTDLVAVVLRNTDRHAGAMSYSIAGSYEGRDASGDVVCRNIGYGRCEDVEGSFCQGDSFRISRAVTTIYIELSTAESSLLTCGFNLKMPGPATQGTATARFFVD